jgi:hypothetical protein
MGQKINMCFVWRRSPSDKAKVLSDAVEVLCNIVVKVLKSGVAYSGLDGFRESDVTAMDIVSNHPQDEGAVVMQ